MLSSPVELHDLTLHAFVFYHKLCLEKYFKNTLYNNITAYHETKRHGIKYKLKDVFKTNKYVFKHKLLQSIQQDFYEILAVPGHALLWLSLVKWKRNKFVFILRSKVRSRFENEGK